MSNQIRAPKKIKGNFLFNSTPMHQVLIGMLLGHEPFENIRDFYFKYIFREITSSPLFVYSKFSNDQTHNIDMPNLSDFITNTNDLTTTEHQMEINDLLSEVQSSKYNDLDVYDVVGIFYKRLKEILFEYRNKNPERSIKSRQLKSFLDSLFTNIALNRIRESPNEAILEKPLKDIYKETIETTNENMFIPSLYNNLKSYIQIYKEQELKITDVYTTKRNETSKKIFNDKNISFKERLLKTNYFNGIFIFNKFNKRSPEYKANQYQEGLKIGDFLFVPTYYMLTKNKQDFKHEEFLKLITKDFKPIELSIQKLVIDAISELTDLKLEVIKNLKINANTLQKINSLINIEDTYLYADNHSEIKEHIVNNCPEIILLLKSRSEEIINIIKKKNPELANLIISNTLLERELTAHLLNQLKIQSKNKIHIENINFC